MTGRERIESAFAAGGTSEIPVVLSYDRLYFRDHWDDVTSCPWWHQFDPDMSRRVQCFREATESTGQDWVRGFLIETSAERQNKRLDARPDGVFEIDTATDEESEIHKPLVSGQDVYASRLHEQGHRVVAETPAQIDELIPIPTACNAMEVMTDGRGDLALGLFKELGRTHYPFAHVSTPLWCCHDLWGFEGMMLKVATEPDLVRYASQRYLNLAIRMVREAHAIGAAGIWLEECFTEMISPSAFRELNVPLVSQLVDEIRSLKMNSIYYYTGNPAGKWDHILSIGADALALEEGKKGFKIDIDDVSELLRGRCTLFGNLDSVAVLEQGTEDQLEAEISRQIAAGRKNGGRFVMSLGSPATPDTPLSRVRLFCDLSHEIGRLA